MSMDYIVVVQADAFRIDADLFATESAFANHLKEMKQVLGPQFTRLVLLAPQMTPEDYARKRDHLGVLSATKDAVHYVPAHSTSISRPGFWLTKIIPTWRLARSLMANAGIVQSGMSTQLGRPLMAIANLAAWSKGRPVVFIVDIDFRKHAQRYFALRQWSLKSYLVNRYAYDPLKWFQVWLAPRMFQLVLLKSASLVRDFGGGRSNVRNFYDTAHHARDVLDDAALAERVQWMRDEGRPLRAVYFGRFAPNKGIDRMIDAVEFARRQDANVELALIGGGECLESLRARVASKGMQDRVRFVDAVPYGTELFSLLSEMHVCVAAPLIEDTPRAAFDAMARGLPLVAFDITYFKELAEASRAVVPVQWPSVADMGQALVAVARDRNRLVQLASNAVLFARENTQEIWLRRRLSAIEELTAFGQAEKGVTAASD